MVKPSQPGHIQLVKKIPLNYKWQGANFEAGSDIISVQGDPLGLRLHFFDFASGIPPYCPQAIANSALFAAAQVELGRQCNIQTEDNKFLSQNCWVTL